MADDAKEAQEPDEQPGVSDQEQETWEWARAAGVSREELLKALERAA